jgi:hypothetical protein
MDKRFGRKTVAVALAGLLLLSGFVWVLVPPDTENYWQPLAKRELQADEFGQWQYVRNLYKKMDATGDSFSGWDSDQQDMWKYAIAFLGYGMPSLAMIKPEWHDEITFYFSIMINKMKSKKVWEDWQKYGFGEDPICRHNIMYKGHLNLMYGLYQLMSGDDRYADEFTWLTQTIVKEIRDSKSKSYQGVVCEPNQYFVQCNAIGLLGLYLYDLIYGTNYRSREIPQTLQFIEERLRDPVTGLYWESYHPSHDVSVRELSGYTNAWALTVLRIFDPQHYEAVYHKWRDVFVEEWGPFAYVRETPYGGASRIATLFGLLAAKEFGDRELFSQLKYTIDTLGYLQRDGETGQLRFLFADNTLLNGMTLAFKLHMGFADIIRHPWQHEAQLTIPETADLTWKDILIRKEQL